MTSRKRGSWASWAFQGACAGAALSSLLILAVLLGGVLVKGWSRLSWSFVVGSPSIFPEKAGILPALLGTLWLAGITAAACIPIGVGAAVYLEEYARPSWRRTVVQLNISNLAGVPSIVYGILGLGLFGRLLNLQTTVLAGGLTLSLVVLPIVILASQEALRGVPASLRHASYGVGATRWQTIWRIVLPAAAPGVMTGVILAMSRAIGEAAPLIALGAATFVTRPPTSLSSEFSALPLQIFSWAGDPRKAFQPAASAAILVLLATLLCLNGAAVFVRAYFGKKVRW